MDDSAVAVSEDLLVLGLAAAVVLSALVSLWSWRLTVVLLLAAGVPQAHLGVQLTFAVASYNVTLLDPLITGITVSCVIRFLTFRRLDLVAGCWLALTALSMLAFLRGGSAVGLGTAAVSFRPDLYFVVAALYMQTFDWTPVNLDRFATLWLIAGGVLALYAAACWVEPALVVSPTSMAQSNLGRAYMQWRVLPSSSALLIASAGLIGFALWARSSGTTAWQLLAVLLLIVVALLYHRSVWVATSVAVASAAVVRPEVLGRLLPPVVLTTLALFVIWALGGELLTSAFDTAVSEPFDESSTWAWRTRNWRTMVPETIAAGWKTTVFGWGYGVGFADPVSGSPLANPHNAYVQAFVNMGVLGLGALVACLVVPLWLLWRHPVPEGQLFDRTAAVTLLVALVVYLVPYSPAVDQGLLVGVVAGLAARARMTHRGMAAAGHGTPVGGA